MPVVLVVAAPARWRVSLAGWVAGFGTSMMATEIISLALTFAALRSGSPAAVAAVVAAVSVARVVMLLLGGAIADRVRHPGVLLTITGVGRIVLMLGIVAFLALGHYSVIVLVAVSFIGGCFDGIYLPSAGVLPQQMAAGDAARQRRVGGLRTSVLRLGIMAGNVLGGWAVAAGGPVSGFGAAGLLFIFAVAFLPVIRPSAFAKPETGEGGMPAGPKELLSNVGEGVRAVRETPGVMSLLVMVGVANIGFAGPMTAGIPVMAAERGWGASGAGLLLGGFAAGAAVVGVVLFLRPLRSGYTTAMLLGTVGMGVCLLGIGSSASYVVTMGFSIMLGIASGLSGSQSWPLITNSVPTEHAGQATSLFELTQEVGAPLSMAAAGAIATAGYPAIPFLGGGLVVVAATIFAGLQPRVRRLSMPVVGER